MKRLLSLLTLAISVNAFAQSDCKIKVRHLESVDPEIESSVNLTLESKGYEIVTEQGPTDADAEIPRGLTLGEGCFLNECTVHLFISAFANEFRTTLPHAMLKKKMPKNSTQEERSQSLIKLYSKSLKRLPTCEKFVGWVTGEAYEQRSSPESLRCKYVKWQHRNEQIQINCD